MIYNLGEKKVKIATSAFLAPSADIVGDVEIGEDSSIWFNVTIRGDGNFVRIGNRTNIQDNCVVHITTNRFPALIGNGVTIGHSAIIHAAELKDFSFVGMGAIVLDGATVSEFGFVAAGAVVPMGFIVPTKTLVAGVPARVIRELREEEIEMIRNSADSYVRNGQEYKASLNSAS